MSKEKEGEGSGENPEFNAEALSKLTEQVDNLNKGIATYRDEARNATEAAKVANEKIADMEKSNKQKEDDKNKEDLSPEDQKKFDAWAKTQGIVTQAELDTQKAQIAQESAKSVATNAVNEFLEKHPEYDEDTEWQKIQTEFNQYKQPSDIAGYKKILEKIHDELSGGTDERAKAKVKAELANKKSLSLGGKGGGNSGDSEAKIDTLQSKYPNLSREQIEARISEIDSIYKKEEEKKEE